MPLHSVIHAYFCKLVLSPSSPTLYLMDFRKCMDLIVAGCKGPR